LKIIKVAPGATIAEIAHDICTAQGDADVVALMDYTGKVRIPGNVGLLREAGVNLPRLLISEPRDAGGELCERMAREVTETLRRTQAVDAMFVVRNAPDGAYT
jgi:hypothetical protein